MQTMVTETLGGRVHGLKGFISLMPANLDIERHANALDVLHIALVSHSFQKRPGPRFNPSAKPAQV